MASYVVTLTEVEDLALSFAALDQEEWINNAVHERCRIAIDDIVTVAVQKCLDQGIQLPVTREEIVKLAFEKEWVLTAKEFNKRSLELPIQEQ